MQIHSFQDFYLTFLLQVHVTMASLVQTDKAFNENNLLVPAEVSLRIAGAHYEFHPVND